MFVAIDELREFYRSPLGRISRRILQDGLLSIAGDASSARVMGFGYATPYLKALSPEAERVMALMPAKQGAEIWPADGPGCTALVDPLELPLTDSAIDMVVATHLFEYAREPEELMQELWRVTAPGAQLIIMVPKRRGMWSQLDNTPFGHGHPFSRNQLARLLEAHSFKPEIWREVLYMPPSGNGAILKSARLFEGLGRLAGPIFAGILMVRAKKQMYPAVTRTRRSSHLVQLPRFAPQPALPTHGSGT